MKSKILNILLILTTVFGYLEWARVGYSFLFQAEVDLFSRLFIPSTEVIHPISVILFVGHILLLITLFQKKPNETLTYAGIGILGLLMGYLFVIGAMNLDWKTILSALPFLIVAVLTGRHHRQMNRVKLNESIPGMI